MFPVTQGHRDCECRCSFLDIKPSANCTPIRFPSNRAREIMPSKNSDLKYKFAVRCFRDYETGFISFYRFHSLFPHICYINNNIGFVKTIL